MKVVLRNVQILRFVAAAMVLISHLQHEVPSVRGIDSTGYSPFTPIWFPGGVDIFFVISGFIMYVIAADDFGTPGAARSFIGRRLERVVPPYWLFTTAMVVATLLFASHVQHPNTSAMHVLASYLFFPFENAYGKIYPVLILGWTLNFEMLFYAVFAVGLSFHHRLGLTVIFSVIVGLGIAGWVSRPSNAPFSFWCDPIVFEFLYGILIGLMYRSGIRLRAPIAWTLATVGVGLMGASMAAGVAGHAWPLRMAWMGVPAALVCAAAALAHDEGPASRIRNCLVQGGNISFALYLSHPFALTAVAALWPYTGIRSPAVYFAAGALVSIVTSFIVYKWIELPLLSKMKRWRSDRGRAAVVTGRAGAET